MKKSVCFLAILLLISFMAKAQHGNSFFSRLYFGNTLPDQMIYLSMNGGMSAIANESISNVTTDWTKREQFGYGLYAGYMHRIQPLLSIGAGLGVQQYGMDIRANSDFMRIIEGEKDNSDLTSFENHNKYDALITYVDISQKTSLTFLNLPIFIMFSNISYNTWGFFVKTGLCVSFPMSDSFEANGDYTQKGKYHAFGGVVLPDIHGLYAFSENLYTGATHYELNKVGLSAVISAGITLPVRGIDGLIISLGPTFNRSLIPVAKAGETSNLDYHNDFNYLLEKDDGGRTSLLGINFMLSYGIGRLIY